MLPAVIDEASDFKFGMQLGFAKIHHQISLEKSGCGPGLESSPKFGVSCDVVDCSDYAHASPAQLTEAAAVCCCLQLIVSQSVS